MTTADRKPWMVIKGQPVYREEDMTPDEIGVRDDGVHAMLMDDTLWGKPDARNDTAAWHREWLASHAPHPSCAYAAELPKPDTEAV